MELTTISTTTASPMITPKLPCPAARAYPSPPTANRSSSGSSAAVSSAKEQSIPAPAAKSWFGYLGSWAKGMCSSAFHSRAQSVDDVVALLDSLLLVSALNIAFSITAMQSVEHDSLVAADARNRNVEFDFCIAEGRGDTAYCTEVYNDWDEVLSWQYMKHGFLTVVLNLISLTLGLLGYISFNFTDCRVDPVFFAKWWQWWKFEILAGYGVFFAGVYQLFVQNHIFVHIAYPFYLDLGGRTYAHTVPHSLVGPVFNTTLNRYQDGGVTIQSLAQRYRQNSLSTFFALMGVGTLATVFMVVQHKHDRKKKAREAAAAKTCTTCKITQTDDVISKLSTLSDLHIRKLLSSEEFQEAKRIVLATASSALSRAPHPLPHAASPSASPAASDSPSM